MQQRRSLQGGAVRPRRAVVLPVVVSVLLVVALVATQVFSGNRILHVQSLGAGAPEVYTASESFASGANITVDDAAIRTQGGEEGEVRRVVKEFTNDRDFSIVGLTWTGDRDIAAFVRSQKADGTWSEWFEMDPIDPPKGSDKFGTEPIFVGKTKRVQVSTGGVDLLDGGRTDSGAPTTAKDLNAVFLDGGEGQTQGGINPVADSYTWGMPKVITRAQWGAGSSQAKSACETIYRNINRSVMVVRPGLIAGYGDETGRSGYYPWRFAHPTGENVIVPDPAFPVAMIDVKDLADWIVESAEVGTFGTFNATGFATSLSDVFKISRELTASEATERPCSDELLLANDVTPWMGPKSLPLWVPGEQFRNIALLDCATAYEAGLQIRPLKETLADALRFEEEQQGERLAGLSDEEEVVLRQRLEDGI